MTDQDILERAIQKAIYGGWDTGDPAGLENFKVLQNKTAFLVKFESNGRVLTSEYKTLIFNHNFAKALWGEEPYDAIQGEVYDSPKWKVVLQQMVIADNPIKYLGENI